MWKWLGRVALGCVLLGCFALVGVQRADASHRFSDVESGHLFHSEIDWLASAGITRSCNPPDNDRFCPDDPVTRGQMAAFLVRALGLPKGAMSFADTEGHVFASDIAALADAGITKGCNPPDNDRFCPDDPVTRGQMAAFLVRALGGGGEGGGDSTPPPPPPSPKMPTGLVVMGACRGWTHSEPGDEYFIRLEVISPESGEDLGQRFFTFPVTADVRPATSCGTLPQGDLAPSWNVAWDANYERLAVIKLPQSGRSATIGYMEFERDGTGTTVWTRSITLGQGQRPTRLYLDSVTGAMRWNTDYQIYTASDFGRGPVKAVTEDECTSPHYWRPLEGDDWVLCGYRVRVSPDGKWAVQEALNLPYTTPGKMHLWERPQPTLPETAAVVELDRNVVCRPVGWIDNSSVLCDDGAKVTFSADKTKGTVQELLTQSYLAESIVLSPDRKEFAFESCPYGQGCEVYRARVDGTGLARVKAAEGARKWTLVEWR